MNEPLRKEIQLENGVISVLEAGPESGTPVVCIHGVPTGAELWRGVLKRLGDAGFCAYAPDMPGYGRTRLHDGGDYSLAGAAEFVASWMQALDIVPAVIVSHDIGGGVLQILAFRHPELVDQMVFSNAIVGDSWPVAPIRLLIWTARMGLLPFIGASGIYHFEPYLNYSLRRTFADPALAGRMDFRQRIFFDSKMISAEGRHAFAAHLRSLSNSQTLDVEKSLGELDMPVLLLWGLKDPYQPWNGPGERLNRIFPRAAVEFLEDAGHFLMLEKPDAYAERLINWLGVT